MATETYAAKEMLINVGGVPLFEFSDSDIVEVEYPDDLFKTSIGADGYGARVAMASRFIRFTITLQQTSPSNDYMMQLLENDLFTLQSTVTVEVKDGLGNSVAFANEAYTVKMPKMGFKKDMSSRVWVMEAVQGVMHVGGNAI